MTLLRAGHRSATALVLLLATAATLLVAPGRAEAATLDASAEAEFVRLINQSRAAVGAEPLRVVSDLTAEARSHTQDMAAMNSLHHNPDLGSDVSNWKLLSENVGYGTTVSGLHDAFMNSDGHRRNLLDTRVTEVGIGVYVDGRTMWVTEVFRLPKVATVESSGSTTAPGEGVPLWGDWDGDGVATPGRFKDGLFTFSNSRDGSGKLVELRYGQAGDKPVVGDWDGDGVDTVGVVRGNLFILRNEYRAGAEDIVLAYGKSTDKPVTGDWDGDGKDTIGVVRGNLFILRNEYRRGAEDILLQYGQPTDKPVAGDWDGDGKDTIGVVRGNLWILRNEYKRGADDILMQYGWSSDQPIVGDYDGDGDDTLGIVRGDLWVLRNRYVSGAKDVKLNF